MVVGSFVRYRDAWYPNGDSTWSPTGLDHFEKLKKEAEQHDTSGTPKYDQLLEQSGGIPFFYFATRQELVTFLTRDLGLPGDSEVAQSLPAETDFALGLSGKDKTFAIMIKAATCLYDKRNPRYDKAKAKTLALNVAMHMPASLLKYAMDHNMLPDAAVASIYGEERGKVLFHDNYDFLARAIMRNEYVEG